MSKDRCWLWDNGFAESANPDGTDNDVLAGYMDNGPEQEHECRLLRGSDPCPVHDPEEDDEVQDGEDEPLDLNREGDPALNGAFG